MRASNGVIEVREARREEHPEVGRVARAAWQEFARSGDPVWGAYFELLGDVERRATRAVVLVALLDGSVVGTATVELDSSIDGGEALEPERANFRMLAVDPRWRHRGTGHRCLGFERDASADFAITPDTTLLGYRLVL